MGDVVKVSTKAVSYARGILLVLQAQDGSGRAWSKTYDAPIFLAMDCMDLGLVDETPTLDDDFVVRGGTRLRPEGEVDVEHIQRCCIEEF